MKRFTAIALIVTLIFCVSACRKKEQQKETAPSGTTQPITVPTMPDMTVPSTNIPDPTVESHSTTPTMDENESDSNRDNTTDKESTK